MNIYSAENNTIDLAAKQILSGKVIAFPTETVYGLGADATNSKAVEKIYKIKNRPKNNPLIIHVNSIENALNFGIFNKSALKIARKFWPGPLTLVLPSVENSPISGFVTSGLRTIAIRIPKNKIARKLIKIVKKPIAAPSANISGKLSPTQAQHVYENFRNNIDMIIDGGACKLGIESTVIFCSNDSISILRPGIITLEDVEETINKKIESNIKNNKVISPGTLKKHYAPKLPIKMNVTSVSPEEALLTFGKLWPKGSKTTMNLSKNSDLKEAAANLFSMLNKLDKSGAKNIAVTKIPNEGIGVAINDKLKRASEK
ncbi:L-threonylcarbamoyladenylate synthase [Alphaproteobacteria bacterium]|nr:L-threonylcarbamoyladenylate synthase [Alphaproteobacteria bacterium]